MRFFIRKAIFLDYCIGRGKLVEASAKGVDWVTRIVLVSWNLVENRTETSRTVLKYGNRCMMLKRPDRQLSGRFGLPA